jgi:hypothetical protein
MPDDLTQAEKDYIATIELLRREKLKLDSLLLIYEERIGKLRRQLALNNIKETE